MSAMVKRYGKVFGGLVVLWALLLIVGLTINWANAQTRLMPEPREGTTAGQPKEKLSDDSKDEPNNITEADDQQDVQHKVYGPEIVVFDPVNPDGTKVIVREVISNRDSKHRVWEVIRERTVIDPITLVEKVFGDDAELITKLLKMLEEKNEES